MSVPTIIEEYVESEMIMLTETDCSCIIRAIERPRPSDHSVTTSRLIAASEELGDEGGGDVGRR